MNRSQTIEKLFVAVKADPERILQQTVCYDHSNSQTISILWGNSVQVYGGNILLPDLLPLQRTFIQWKRGANFNLASFMLNVRDFLKDPCQRPAILFMETAFSDRNGTQYLQETFCLKLLAKGFVKEFGTIQSILSKIRTWCWRGTKTTLL